MAKVCLVRPMLSPSDFNGYPLNLLILGSALRNFDHEVLICDFDLLKEQDATWAQGGFAARAAKLILQGQPEFVGITSMCSNYVLALDLARELKRLSPTTHVTFGGPHVSLCACETLSGYEYVDTAVIGEGEETYPDLIDAVINSRPLSEVDGIAYRSDGVALPTKPRKLMADLDESPRPAYDLVDMSSYIAVATDSYFELYAGSGCPFQCSFCSTSIVWQRKYRTKSPMRIAQEAAHLYNTYGITAINLIHDNLTSNRKFVLHVAEEIRNQEIPIQWGFSSRVDTIDNQIIESVVEAGCDYVFFGIESGSEKTQHTMGKRLKLARAEDALTSCLAHGIKPTASFILGFPEEDVSDIERTVKLAFQCKVAGARRSFINLLSAYTGTPVMQDHLERMRFLPDAANSTMIAYLENHHFTLIEHDPFVFSNYYSLDYSESPLTASEYLNLVDFFTISLFRYSALFNFLFKDAGVSPLSLFRRFEAKVALLSTDDRNSLSLEISPEDVDSLVGNLRAQARSMLQMDNALWEARNSSEKALLAACKVEMTAPHYSNTMKPSDRTHFYLMRTSGDGVYVQEIPSDCFHLYGAQGLPQVFTPSYVQ